jgi:hypothetical protein
MIKKKFPVHSLFHTLPPSLLIVHFNIHYQKTSWHCKHSGKRQSFNFHLQWTFCRVFFKTLIAQFSIINHLQYENYLMLLKRIYKNVKLSINCHPIDHEERQGSDSDLDKILYFLCKLNLGIWLATEPDVNNALDSSWCAEFDNR